jgi:hypothetical protein
MHTSGLSFGIALRLMGFHGIWVTLGLVGVWFAGRESIGPATAYILTIAATMGSLFTVGIAVQVVHAVGSSPKPLFLSAIALVTVPAVVTYFNPWYGALVASLLLPAVLLLHVRREGAS